MLYTLYVNYPHRRGTLHASDCTRVLNRKKAEDTDNGFWEDGFQSEAQARGALEDSHKFKDGTPYRFRRGRCCIG